VRRETENSLDLYPDVQFLSLISMHRFETGEGKNGCHGYGFFGLSLYCVGGGERVLMSRRIDRLVSDSSLEYGK